MRANAYLPIRVSLVIPVYNNEKTIVRQIDILEKILNSLCRQYEIIISDDKSFDDTAKLMQIHYGGKQRIRLIFNKTNMGIAQNIRQLYTFAKYEYVTLFSVDGGWKPQDVKRLLMHIYTTNADFVIGLRNKQKYNFYRRLISFFYNFLPYALYGIRTIDAGSIKVFKRFLFHNTQFISTSVFFEAEMIMRTKKMGYKVLSIPISFTTNRKRVGEGAKLSLIFQSIKDIVRLKMNGF